MADYWQRFRAGYPCLMCDGGADMAQGKGRCCYGFLLVDGDYAYCTREEHIAQLERYATVGLLAARRSGTAMDPVQRRDAPPSPPGQRASDDPPVATSDGEVTKVDPLKYICITLSQAPAHLVVQFLCLAVRFLFRFDSRTSHYSRSHQLHSQFNRVPNQLHAKCKRNPSVSLAKGEQCRVLPHNRL